MVDEFPDDISFNGWRSAVDVEEFEIQDVIEAVKNKRSTGDFEVKSIGKIISIWRRDQPEATVRIVSQAAEDAFIREIRGMPIESETERGFREATSNPKA